MKVALRVLFRMENLNTVDGLSFIESLHTTVRSLEICSEIIRVIGKDQTPREILQKQIFNWSNKIENIYAGYRNLKGKLTKDQKPTTAFIHYVDFLNNINLISKLNDNYRNTKYGMLLNYLNKEKDEMTFRLTKEEKLFYLLILFKIDSDGLLTALNLIIEPLPSQKKILEKFYNVFTNRLETKLKYSNNFGKIEIEEKLRNISVNWNNIQKYSEHIIPPRLEWLSSLELINIKRNSSETGYSVTEKGREFYRQIPILENQVNDLNTFWYNNHAITTFSNIIWDTDLVAWNKFHDSNKDNYFKIVLYKAVDIYGKDGAMRMSLNITLLFIILELIKNYKIIIEFVEIEKMLSPIFITEKFIFSLHKAARETESYISIKIA